MITMNHKTILEVTTKLIGHIDAVGESRYDEESLDNLEQYDLLLNNLIDILVGQTRYRNSKEFSIQEIGNKSDDIVYNTYMNIKDLYEYQGREIV